MILRKEHLKKDVFKEKQLTNMAEMQIYPPVLSRISI